MNKQTAILEAVAMVKLMMPNFSINNYPTKFSASDLADFIDTLASRLEQMTRE